VKHSVPPRAANEQPIPHIHMQEMSTLGIPKSISDCHEAVKQHP
jgi:hypothetical protein